MKVKYLVSLVAVVVTTFSLAALAQNQGQRGKVYQLKAGGQTIAELRVRDSANVTVNGANANSQIRFNPTTETISGIGGVTLKLTAGKNSVSVQAEEIQEVPEPK